MAMYRKLGKKSDQRIALLRNQVTQLLYHGKIETTEARAKEVLVDLLNRVQKSHPDTATHQRK